MLLCSIHNSKIFKIFFSSVFAQRCKVLQRNGKALLNISNFWADNDRQHFVKVQDFNLLVVSTLLFSQNGYHNNFMESVQLAFQNV